MHYLTIFTEFRVRKYGAHGINYKYVSEQIKIMFKKDKLKMIICHLGNGSSISAVKNSQCIDTSMGFTPLSGVMMGTRTEILTHQSCHIYVIK